MTQSEIFKAAHKNAKLAKAKFGGDYVVYLSFYMKKGNSLGSVRNERTFNFTAKSVKYGSLNVVVKVKEQLCKGYMTPCEWNWKYERYIMINNVKYDLSNHYSNEVSFELYESKKLGFKGITVVSCDCREAIYYVKSINEKRRQNSVCQQEEILISERINNY